MLSTGRWGLRGLPGEAAGPWPEAPSTHSGSRRPLEALVRDGAARGWVTPESATAGHLSGVCAGDKRMTTLDTNGRDPGKTGALAHLLDGDLLRHIIHHTHHICLQVRECGTALPEASCPRHPGTHRQGRAGPRDQEAIFHWYSPASAPRPRHRDCWSAVQTSDKPFPAHFQAPALQLWSMSPLKGSEQTQPPPKLGTPALAVVFYFYVTVGREDEEDNSTMFKRSF